MKKIILAIDIQNEYVTEGGAFRIHQIERSLKNAKMIIEMVRRKGIPVWHIRHEQEEGVFLKGTPLVDFVFGFEPIAGEYHFTKDLYSAFSSSDFTKKLSEEKPDEIILVGYGSSMCLLCTVIDGIHRGYRFCVVEDATASRAFPHATEEEMHASAITILKQYVKIQKTELLLQELGAI